jgi:hypothetical protein
MINPCITDKYNIKGLEEYIEFQLNYYFINNGFAIGPELHVKKGRSKSHC